MYSPIERFILILMTPQHEFQNVIVKEVLLEILDMIYAKICHISAEMHWITIKTDSV